MVHLRSLFSGLTLLSTLALVGCGDDTAMTTEGSSGGSSGSSSQGESSAAMTTSTTGSSTTVEPTGGTSTSDPSTGTSGPTTDPSTGTGTESSSGTSGSSGDTSGDTTTGGPVCVAGEVNCDCVNDSCVGQAVCVAGKCLPTGDGSCFSEFDFYCDEPEFCPVGSDPFDCCASAQDSICEEFDYGGACPPFSDFFDCGYCLFENDGECDAPDLCPDGTDVADCCATPQNGVCEEQSQGGMCPDGSDTYDCGGCPFEFDGFCDVPFDCPEGTDLNDCCATPQDGVCEEMQAGGACPDGSDPYDCGVCPYENDGFCDVPFDCPGGTDLDDCCATPQNGVCEEMQAGGLCPDGTDPYDCGACPYENDGFCDVPDFCPGGTDLDDCCATPQNGVCEEMQAGGECQDGTDPYDCGVCPYENDFECDVPDLCPEGTDLNDCP